MIDVLLSRVRNEVRRIWCYRWLVAVTTVLCWCAAAVYVHRLPSTYDAWGQIYVEQQTPLVSAAEGVSLVGKNYGSPYVVLTTLLNEDNLERIVRQIEPEAASQGEAGLAAAAARLRNRIKRADPGENFIELHVTDTDPVRARDTVRLLIDQFISTTVGRSQSELERAGAFLDEQIASYEAKLGQSQEEIAAFRRSHPEVLLQPTGGPGVAPGAYPAPATAAAPSSAGPEPATATPAAPRPPTAAEQRVAELEARLASLKTTYTDRYPDVVITRRQLADAIAARDLEAAARPPVTPAAARQARRTSSTAGVAHWAPPPPLPPEVATRWADLQRTDEVLRTNHQQLLMKRAATRMSLDVYRSDERGKYQVLRQPTVPVIPNGPNRTLYLLAAGVLSIGAGVAVGYARAAARGILISRQEVEEIYQLPVIGTVSWEPAWHTERSRHALFAGGRRRLRVPEWGRVRGRG